MDGAQKHDEILEQIKTMIDEHTTAAITNVGVGSQNTFIF